ncbi:MAG: hypothetical protein ACR2OX_09570, partial [Methyloligellaceae bacterium]
MADTRGETDVGASVPLSGHTESLEAKVYKKTASLADRVSENWLFVAVRRLWRTLWVTRVATLSVVIGFFLLWNVTQVQDLFAEIKGDPAIGIPFWAAFYAFVILIWAFPVYLSSKLSLDYYRECIDQNAFGAFWPKYYPSILVALIFLAIFCAVIFSLSNLHLTSMAQDA